LIEAVIERCARFDEAQYVICTNLHEVGEAQWRLFDRPNLYISTSLDGDLLTHARQRTGNETGQFEANLRAVIERYGPSKVSALPTIDPNAPPEIDSIIDTYSGLGLTSIFLRPINYQGFARKRHSDSRDAHAGWGSYHREFIKRLIERNWDDRTEVLEETYFSICLRRIFHPGTERHVDLRNPNPVAVDYLVIDYDGRLYPTDEARMLSRSGVIDLSVGQVGDDWRGEKWRQLNEHATNHFDEACSRCVYQPFCGRDIVDDLARYGSLDVPRTETAFCHRHLSLFDFIFELLYDDDPPTRYSLCRWLRIDAETMALGELVA
jgi:radical SAM protein with 4Fe4S-binding SPASM domain